MVGAGISCGRDLSNDVVYYCCISNGVVEIRSIVKRNFREKDPDIYCGSSTRVCEDCLRKIEVIW